MKRILAFGDSVMKGVITQSTVISEGTLKYTISDQGFVQQCERSWERPIQNLSRFGNTILSGQKNIDRYMKDIRFGDAVALEFGGNDCNFDWAAIAENPTGNHQPVTTLEVFRATYLNIIDKLTTHGAMPVLLSLPALASRLFFNHVSKGLDRQNILRWLGGDVNFINNWHEQYNLEIFKIGTQRQVPVIDITSIFLRQHNLEDYYCIDGMHPNEAGHALITDAILQFRF